MPRCAVLCLSALLAAACADEEPFFVPAEEPRQASGGGASCLVDDDENDGRIDAIARLVESDGGRTWTVEEYDGVGTLQFWSVQHYDAGDRLLDSEAHYEADRLVTRCFYTYDSFGRETGTRCDGDGDGTYEETEDVTAWNDAGQVTAARHEDPLGGPVAITHAYDARGRVVLQEWRRLVDGIVEYRSECAYDDAARTKTYTTTTGRGSARTVMTYDRNGHRIRSEYTPLSGETLEAYVETQEWSGDLRVRTDRVYSSGQHFVERRVPCSEVL